MGARVCHTIRVKQRRHLVPIPVHPVTLPDEPIYTIIYGDDTGLVVSYVEHGVGLSVEKYGLTPKDVFERWVEFRDREYENPPIWAVMYETDVVNGELVDEIKEIARWEDETRCSLIDPNGFLKRYGGIITH